MDESAKTRSSIPWQFVVPAIGGLLLGAVLGLQYAFLASGPQGGWFPAELGIVLVGVVLVGGVGLLSLILLIPERTRSGGQIGLTFAGSMLVGWIAAAAIGPRYQFSDRLDGHVEVTITVATTTATLEADATCWTEDNGTAILRVYSPDLGRIGIDNLDLDLKLGYATVDGGPAQIEIGIDARAGYGGSASISSIGDDKRSGRASFLDLRPNRFRIGGASEGTMPPGAASVSGLVTWSCDTPAMPVERDYAYGDVVQGWFVLRGAVTMPHSCAREGGCLPYGYTIAICDASQPHLVEAVDGIVPWVDGRRARLHLVPGEPTASLTVEVEGQPAREPVEGPASVRSDLSSGHATGTRVLTGRFELPEGSLGLEVEWFCGDNYEAERK